MWRFRDDPVRRRIEMAEGFPLNQERIVGAIAVILFVGFSVFVHGFLNATTSCR